MYVCLCVRFQNVLLFYQRPHAFIHGVYRAFGLCDWADEWGIHVFHTDYIHCVFSALLVGVILCPFDYFFRSTRVFLAKTLLGVIISPFTKVAFRHVFIGDLLCSLVKCLLDLNYAVCFYSTESYLSHDATQCQSFTNNAGWVLALLPYLWRFLQCLRRFYDDPAQRNHILNAIKYMSTICTVGTNMMATYFQSPALLWLWVLMAFGSSGYSFWWDVIHDWGLGKVDGTISPVSFLLHKKKDRPNKSETLWMLRPNLIHSPIAYYVVIVLNLLLRVSWIVTVSPVSFGINISPPFLTMLVAALEIYRRFQWNIFRCDWLRVVLTLSPVD